MFRIGMYQFMELIDTPFCQGISHFTVLYRELAKYVCLHYIFVAKRRTRWQSIINFLHWPSLTIPEMNFLLIEPIIRFSIIKGRKSNLRNNSWERQCRFVSTFPYPLATRSNVWTFFDSGRRAKGHLVKIIYISK